MLTRLPNVLMLSEPSVLERIFYLSQPSFTQKTALLIAMMNSLSAAMTGEEKRLIVKFSGGTDWLPWIQKVYPKTPWIYVYRDPSDVIRSNLQNPPSWLSAIEEDAEKQEVLTRKYESQLETVIENRERAALIVNYSEINDEFPRRLLTALRLPVTQDSIRTMRESLGRYSKNENVSWTERQKRSPEHTYRALSAPVPQSLMEKYLKLEGTRFPLQKRRVGAEL